MEQLNESSQLAAVGRCARAGARARVVIIDSGDRAAVIVLDDGGHLVVGSRFRHGGVDWEVTGRRRPGRVLVAQPVQT